MKFDEVLLEDNFLHTAYSVCVEIYCLNTSYLIILQYCTRLITFIKNKLILLKIQLFHCENHTNNKGKTSQKFVDPHLENVSYKK